jgi:hypothetical protein
MDAPLERGRLYSAAVPRIDTNPIELGESRFVFPFEPANNSGAHGWGSRHAVTSDARRFLGVSDTDNPPPNTMTVVIDWASAMAARSSP